MLNVRTATPPQVQALDLQLIKCGWACRVLNLKDGLTVVPAEMMSVGDVLITRVEAVRHHGRLMDTQAARVRLYEGDQVMGVVGHRYATDAYDAEAVASGETVDLLTNAGLLGRVRRRHTAVGLPTRMSVVGRLATAQGEPINLIDRVFTPRSLPAPGPKVVFVVGTGMNAGKTTTAAKLTRSLLRRGWSVVALKATGSVSPNDRLELAATGARGVRDFSDYGFPSTHRLAPTVLDRLVETMIADAADHAPDIVVVELADGILQSETQLVLQSFGLERGAVGAVLAAPCAASALMGIEVLKGRGIRVLGVSGLISNAPLFVDELANNTAIPFLSSAGDGQPLGQAVASSCHSHNRAA